MHRIYRINRTDRKDYFLINQLKIVVNRPFTYLTENALHRHFTAIRGVRIPVGRKFTLYNQWVITIFVTHFFMNIIRLLEAITGTRYPWETPIISLCYGNNSISFSLHCRRIVVVFFFIDLINPCLSDYPTIINTWLFRIKIENAVQSQAHGILIAQEHKKIGS